MKPILRYQSQLLYRRSYKPNRTIRIRPTQAEHRVPPGEPVRPKPQLTIVS